MPFIAINFLIDSLCGPVNGLYPKLPSACRSPASNKTAGGNGTGLGPSSTGVGGGATSVPYLGQGTGLRVGELQILLGVVMSAGLLFVLGA